jgi:GT2 family glycosyltransferase
MSRPAILIPVHNRKAATLACLHRLCRNGDLSRFDVIVIDDGSTDGTSDAVRAEFPEVVILSGDGELYWTGAIALAMEFEATRPPRPVFWLNDDCLPQPGALPLLADFLERHPDSLVGPRCVDAATRTPVPTAFIGRRQVAAEPGAPCAVHGLSGFCVGLGAVAARRLGSPDAKNFPHYYGDTASTLRAHRLGCAVMLVGDAVVDLVDYGCGPGALGSHLRPGASWPDNWRRVFGAKKSPHRLRTLFAYQTLKYGAPFGSALALTRAAHWIVMFVWAHVQIRAKEPTR